MAARSRGHTALNALCRLLTCSASLNPVAGGCASRERPDARPEYGDLGLGRGLESSALKGR